MKFSDAEWRLMTALWARNPASARDVHDAVVTDTGWAYSTVKTMLSRLVEKGALAVVMLRNAAQYTPKVSQEAGRRSALRTLINQAFGGSAAPLMAQLLGDEALSARDKDELSRLLRTASESASESASAVLAGAQNSARTTIGGSDAGRPIQPKGDRT